MAQVTVTKIVEGQSHLVVRLEFLGDGSGDLNTEVVVSPSDLVPPRANNQPCFRIMQEWHGLGFDMTFGYGTLQPEAVWTIAKNSGSHTDFRSFGGLRDKDTVPPGDENGKLWITTSGLVSGLRGSVVLELRKLNV